MYVPTLVVGIQFTSDWQTLVKKTETIGCLLLKSIWWHKIWFQGFKAIT